MITTLSGLVGVGALSSGAATLGWKPAMVTAATAAAASETVARARRDTVIPLPWPGEDTTALPGNLAP